MCGKNYGQVNSDILGQLLLIAQGKKIVSSVSAFLSIFVMISYGGYLFIFLQGNDVIIVILSVVHRKWCVVGMVMKHFVVVAVVVVIVFVVTRKKSIVKRHSSNE